MLLENQHLTSADLDRKKRLVYYCFHMIQMMNKRYRRVMPIAALLAIAVCPTLAAQHREETREDSDMYIEALELLEQGREAEAVQVLQDIIEEYPDSLYRERVEQYLQKYAGNFDHSGIVPFYLGNLVSAVAVADGLPLLFDVEDAFIYGGAGIAGIGAGLASAWLLTKDNNMTWGQEIWIEFSQYLTMLNYQFSLFAVVDPNTIDPELMTKLIVGGQIASVIAGRTAGYLLVKDSLPSEAMASFVAQSYMWSYFYLFSTLFGIFESDNDRLNSLLFLAVPDLLAVGSYFLWDQLEWSFARSGLVTVSGLGGMLLGTFINVILGEYVSAELPQVASAIVMGTAIAGKVIGVWVTSPMESAVSETGITRASGAMSGIGTGGVHFYAIPKMQGLYTPQRSIRIEIGVEEIRRADIVYQAFACPGRHVVSEVRTLVHRLGDPYAQRQPVPPALCGGIIEKLAGFAREVGN